MMTTMATKKRSAIKKATSTVKKQAKKATKAGKAVVAKVQRTGSAAKKKASSVGKAATKLVKTNKKKAVATVGTVRGTAKKIATKLKKAQHSASDIAMRVGSTMETIGNALVSLVSPHEPKPKPESEHENP